MEGGEGRAAESRARVPRGGPRMPGSRRSLRCRQVARRAEGGRTRGRAGFLTSGRAALSSACCDCSTRCGTRARFAPCPASLLPSAAGRPGAPPSDGRLRPAAAAAAPAAAAAAAATLAAAAARAFGGSSPACPPPAPLAASPPLLLAASGLADGDFFGGGLDLGLTSSSLVSSAAMLLYGIGREPVCLPQAHSSSRQSTQSASPSSKSTWKLPCLAAPPSVRCTTLPVYGTGSSLRFLPSMYQTVMLEPTPGAGARLAGRVASASASLRKRSPPGERNVALSFFLPSCCIAQPGGRPGSKPASVMPSTVSTPWSFSRTIFRRRDR